MKIAILGGAFNPPHIGHYLVAEQVHEILKMDEVWLMPCFSHAFHKKMASFELRFKMAALLANSYLKVSDFEKRHNPTSRTIDTLRLLAKEYPAYEFSWIIGSDQLSSFHKWHEWQDLVKNFRLVIFPRDLYQKELERDVKKAFGLATLPSNITAISSKHLITSTISSTEIRSRIRLGQGVQSLVTPEVEMFISNNRLYLGNEQ